MNHPRVLRVALGLLWILSIPQPHADTLYMEHGDEMKGRILHIEEGEEGIEYIRFEIEGAVIDVPGTMIERYENEAEPTDTPTVTPTFTSTPTRTLPPPPPTNTPKPYQSPTPTPFIGEFEEIGEGGFEFSWDEEGGTLGEGAMTPQELPEDVKLKLKQLGLVGSILGGISTICYLIAWVICFVDGFRKGTGTGILLLIFGGPWCCVAFPVLLVYTIRGYTGESKKWPLGLLIASLVTYMLIFVIYFSLILSIINTLMVTASGTQ